VVVGAGAAGLAAAAAGRQMGWDPLLLERDAAVGGAWRYINPALQCLSPRNRDQMPDGRCPPGRTERANVAEVLAAIEGYAEAAAHRIRHGVVATGLTRRADGLCLQTTAGDVLTRRVIVATGEYGKPYRLPLEGTFSGSIEHTHDWEKLRYPAGTRVVVVGAGNSGVEAAVSLAAAGVKVYLATGREVRKPPAERRGLLGTLAWWVSGVPISRLPARGGCTHQTPVVNPGLYEAVQRGQVEVVPAAQSLEETGLRVSGGGLVVCEHIVLATGYRRETQWLRPLVSHSDQGVPIHNAGVSPEVPGLGFVGIPCMRTRRSGFLRGFVGDAQSVARRLKG